MVTRFIITFIIITAIVISVDFYVWQGIKTLLQNAQARTVRAVQITFWSFTAFTFVFFASMPLINVRQSSMAVRVVLSLVFALFVLKLIWVVFLLIDDLVRIGRATATNKNPLNMQGINRSTFLQWMGLGIGSTFFGSMIFGITKGAHKYTVHAHDLHIENLPPSFNGLKIVQISDVHSGSFYDRIAVQKGIDIIKEQNADIVFFTGDLVNDRATEMEPWKDVFGQIKAPLGVFSILGNHDYGDYVHWPSPEHKEKNKQDLVQHHRDMGWDILLDEHRIIEKDGHKLAIIGVQNWSAKRNFPKYGDLSKAYNGSQNAHVKLLLSHDPSHWREEVTKHYSDIAVTFSGHTHGMQFGIDTRWYKWSPVKMVYKEWIDLYTQEKQMLYVNRGFGFLGFPGRVGMWPEISVFTLQSKIS